MCGCFSGRPFTVLFGLIALSLLSPTGAEVSVNSCRAFLEALKDDTVAQIIVSGNVRCNPDAAFPPRIDITRNLTVRGEAFGQARLRLPNDTVIVLHSNFFLTFDSLLLFVHTFDEGITLPFMKANLLLYVIVRRASWMLP